MDLATSGRGGIGPFVGICAIVAAFGVADAHVQGGMVGDMAFMCPEFMQVTLLGILFQLFFHSKRQELCILPHLGCLFLQSFFAGLAASGALTSGLRLITKAAFDKSKNGPRKGVSMSLFFELWRNLISYSVISFTDQLEFVFDTYIAHIITIRRDWSFSYAGVVCSLVVISL